jgi:hypothetical protein
VAVTRPKVVQKALVLFPGLNRKPQRASGSIEGWRFDSGGGRGMLDERPLAIMISRCNTVKHRCQTYKMPWCVIESSASKRSCNDESRPL